MASLTTALVGLNSQCLAPGPVGQADADTILVMNQDTENTVNLGSSSTNLALALGPLASITLTAPVYAAAATVPLEVGIAPGGSSYSPGSLTITGPVTAEITGPVTVEGTVGIDGTVDADVTGSVEISNTPSVEISGTPTVDLAAGATVDIGGTASVDITNASVTVIGGGGYIAPGQVGGIYQNSGTITVAPGASTSLGTFDVSTYSSVDFNFGIESNSSSATGAAMCVIATFQWQDSFGNFLSQDVISVAQTQVAAGVMPCNGAQVEISLYNPGSVGTLSFGADYLKFDGSYRQVDAIKFSPFNAGTVPSFSGLQVVEQPKPVNNIGGWISNIANPTVVADDLYMYLLPLYNGMVSGWYQVNTDALTNDAVILDISNSTVGSVNPGTDNEAILVNIPSAVDTSNTQFSMYMPPSQLAVVFKPSAAGTAFFLTLTGKG